MAKKDRNQLKAFFRTGLVPTEQNFEDVFDSLVNLDSDGITVSDDGAPESPRIGLGVGNPASKLDVNGVVQASGFQLLAGDLALGNVLTTDSAGNATWATPPTVGSPTLPPMNPGRVNALELDNFYAMRFSGSNSYIDAGDSNLWNFGNGDFAISAWVKRGVINRRQLIVGKERLDSRQFHLLFTQDDQIQLLYGTGSGAEFVLAETTAKFIRRGQWMHILAQRVADRIEIYVDGSPITISRIEGTAAPMFDSDSPLLIGRREWVGVEDTFQGEIDDVSLWATSFDGDEIPTGIYSLSGPTNLILLPESNSLVGWWRLGENAQWNGNRWVVPDGSARGLHATSQGMTQDNIVLRREGFSTGGGSAF